jgi:hypothetical protein
MLRVPALGAVLSRRDVQDLARRCTRVCRGHAELSMKPLTLENYAQAVEICLGAPPGLSATDLYSDETSFRHDVIQGLSDELSRVIPEADFRTMEGFSRGLLSSEFSVRQ